MTEIAAKLIVLLASVFLIVLAITSFISPARAAAFLNGFASSAKLHFTEMLIRLAVGISLVAAAPEMAFAEWFCIFGWVLVVTSLALILIPWQFHQKFAAIVVPPLTQRVWLFGLLALPLGLVIGASLLIGKS